MERNSKYFLTLLWFTYLFVSSVLLFKKGFLLTRVVQENNATCALINLYCASDETDSSGQCLFYQNKSISEANFNEASNLCLPPRSKVVLLIVDALRYDFTIFNPNNSHPLPYQNKMPIFQEQLLNHPDATRLFKFVADPPTTTMQRLKALTTGSLPTFIDAGSNFATSEINEDNLIDQVLENNYKTVFMGDDTWTSLYPNRFLRNFPYPSFDVWDLDTVDNGVKANLFPELKNSDWHLLIGHFLGIDHCGHRYGPNHPEMARKLTEINYVIKDVIASMDEKSILFVVGDHGMTGTGDHGGESPEETDAAMFIHTKQPLISYGSTQNTVKQVDLIPTLATILGVPIPFQNLGILIFSCLPSSNYNESWKLSLFSLWANVQQIIQYIQTYSENAKIFEKGYINIHFEEYYSLQKKIANVDSEAKFLSFSKEATEFVIKLRKLCEEVWVQFDAFSINNGLIFSILTIFFLFIIGDVIPLNHLSLSIERSFVHFAFVGIVFSIIVLAVLDFSDLIDDFWYTSMFFTNIISHLMFLFPVLQNWQFMSIRNRTFNLLSFIGRLVLLLNICGLFSNSFINEEASVLLFLLVTVLLLCTFGAISQDNSSKKKPQIFPSISLIFFSLAILIFLRASMHFWRCRVEQEWCYNDLVLSKTKSQVSKLQWGLNIISLVVLVNLIKMWLRKCGNLSGYSLTETITKLTPMVIIVFVAGFWVFQWMPLNKKAKLKTPNYLALTVYALTALSVVILIIQPICVCVVKRKEDDLPPQSGEKIIPQIYKKLKTDLSKDSETGSNIPIVYGLGTVYSAAYLILGTYLALVIALVLGDSFAFSVVILFAVAAFFLVVSSILRIKRTDTVDGLLRVPFIAVSGWILLAHYFFYATGHQPAFSNIAWEAAFVGTSGLFSHNYIRGTLIVLNTFGSYIVMGITLPLLVIFPFTCFVMMPSVLVKKKEFNSMASRGELILFEKDRMTSAALFSLSCKYIAGHAIKVFGTMLAANIHSRHLMVWNVFAPKFIFEGIAMFVTLSSVFFGYLFFLRINRQIKQLVNNLNKTNLID